MVKRFLANAAMMIVVSAVGLLSAANAETASEVTPGSASSIQGHDHGEPFAGGVTASGGFTGDVVEGAADATVTIIEYASLSCPHCARFHSDVYSRLKTDYIDTGKVRFIYRDFPLNEAAIVGSIIARCGGETGYVSMVDALLSNQDQWLRSANVFEELLGFASRGGLNQKQVYACLEDESLGQSVLNRMQSAAQDLGVNSTPTVMINGTEFSQSGNYQAISQQLDTLLAK